MFKPTQVLQKSQARLRGQRGPAIRILRKSLRTVNPDAVIPPNLTPKHATAPPRAWKEMGIPIHKLMPEHNQRLELPEFARDQSSEHRTGLISWQEASQRQLIDSTQKESEKLPSIVARKANRIGEAYVGMFEISSAHDIVRGTVCISGQSLGQQPSWIQTTSAFVLEP